MTEYTRYDIPREVRNVLNVAAANDLLDHVDVYALTLQFGDNFEEMVQEVVEIAFADRHTEHGRTVHSLVTRAAEAFWATIHTI